METFFSWLDFNYNIRSYRSLFILSNFEKGRPVAIVIGKKACLRQRVKLVLYESAGITYYTVIRTYTKLRLFSSFDHLI